MFRYIVESPAPVNRKAYVLPISIAAHLVVVAAGVAIPLFAPGVLPLPATTLKAFINADVVPPPPPPVAPAPSKAETPRVEGDTNPELAPIISPNVIGPEPVGDHTSKSEIRGVEAGDGALLGDSIGAVVNAPPPPPPAQPEPPRRVGAEITRPRKIHDVTPVYPVLAQRSRVSGVVIIEATIGPSGAVVDVKVLRGHPLLDASALSAVQQWRFTPTLLNGKAIAVVMTVTVDFKLE